MITWSKAKAKKKALAANGNTFTLKIQRVARHRPILVCEKMVVSSQALADRIGQDVLDRGGNAVDAAVAVGCTILSVIEWAMLAAGFAIIIRRMERDIAMISGSSPERLQRICTLMKKNMKQYKRTVWAIFPLAYRARLPG